MAMEDEDRKNELLGQSGPTDAGSQGSAVAGASGGAVAGGGASPVGGGAKQSSAWTNIQDYLTANKDNHASTDFFKNSVDKTFDQESQNMHDQGEQAKTQSKTAADQSNIGQDQASKLISDASAAGKGSDTYNQNVGQLQQGLKAYTGPTSYSYGLSNQAQQYGTGLQSNPSSVMHDVYNQQVKGVGGTGLTQGQMDLQDLFDANDSGLATAQQSALAKYAGLNADVTDPNGYVAQTNQAVHGYANQINPNQQALNQYLSGAAQSAQDSLTGLVNGWNNDEAYNRSTGRAYGPSGYLKGSADPNAKQSDAQTIALADYNPFYSYQGGGTADASNVRGGSPYRSQWNTIEDVLGAQDKQIADAPELDQHGQWVLDQQGLDKANAAIRANAKNNWKVFFDTTGGWGGNASSNSGGTL